jgi:hypothetical protein
MSKTITTLMSLAIAIGIGAAPAHAGWKLCVRKICQVEKFKPPCPVEACGKPHLVCKNALVDCDEHPVSSSSNGKGNW